MAQNRPRYGDPRRDRPDKTISFRLTQNELHWMDRLGEALGYSRSGMARTLLIPAFFSKLEEVFGLQAVEAAQSLVVPEEWLTEEEKRRVLHSLAEEFPE